MKTLRSLFLCLLVIVSLSTPSVALSPVRIPDFIGEDTICNEADVGADAGLSSGSCGYTDAELNMIANVVDGEVGGIGGAAVTLTYADGSQLYTDGFTLRLIHARVVDNQVRSPMFPTSVSGCVCQCWSPAYTGTGWRDSAQWQSCRQAVVDALAGGIYVPSNVFAATCDPGFSSYPGWQLWARVDWDTGWVSGVFYYYYFG